LLQCFYVCDVQDNAPSHQQQLYDIAVQEKIFQRQQRS
jgi:hypothetical protein